MTEHLRNAIRACLAAGEPAYIMAIRHARSIDIVGIARASGHTAFYVDLQHSTISPDLAAQMCLAGLGLGITPLVRIPGLNHAVCETMLEGGALGIIVPDVRSPDEAAEVAAWCSFPPRGSRSVVNAGPHTGFAPPRQQADRANIARETVVIVMLESEEGIRRADEIAAVEGVDALMIGTNDLTSSMGLHGQYEDPRVKALCGAAITAARKHGKHLIMGGIRDPAIAARYVEAGAARCFVTGTDTALLLAGATAQVEKFRAAI